MYLILFYWIALYFFFKKKRHYYFQRYLYFFIIQTFLLAGALDSGIWIYFPLLKLKIFWLSCIYIYLFIYTWQLFVALLKSSPTIATLEWWDAFHIFNLNSFLRHTSDQKLLHISNKDWLNNQNTKFLYRFSKVYTGLHYFYTLFFYTLFFYTLFYCWTLDTEHIGFNLDFFLYTYSHFLPLVVCFFLILNSLFIRRFKKKYLLTAFTFIFESAYIDRAGFDPNFAFDMRVEYLAEFEQYRLQTFYLRLKESHKKIENPDYCNLSLMTESSRLISNDTWWDCNNLYYSKIFFKKKL